MNLIYPILASILWGFSYFFYGKLIDKGFTYRTLLLLELPIFTVVALTAVKSLDTNLIKSNLLLLFVYFTINILASLCLYFAIKTTNNFTASVIEIAYPLVLLCILIAVGEINFKINQLIGAVIAIIGIAIATQK